MQGNESTRPGSIRMPVKPIILIAISLISCTSAYSQGVKLSADSTSIVFPNKVRIPFEITTDGHNAYKFSAKAFSTLLLQSNYLFQKSSLERDAIGLMNQELSVRDSTVQLSNLMITAEHARAEAYRTSYLELKKISEICDKNTRTLLEEVERLSRQHKKNKLKILAKGVAIGLIIGASGAILLAK